MILSCIKEQAFFSLSQKTCSLKHISSAHCCVQEDLITDTQMINLYQISATLQLSNFFLFIDRNEIECYWCSRSVWWWWCASAASRADVSTMWFHFIKDLLEWKKTITLTLFSVFRSSAALRSWNPAWCCSAMRSVRPLTLARSPWRHRNRSTGS